jgi:NAD(P)-dependent dehydrogenase (short-subunit alcohol dehydrogenase family)
MSSAPVAIVTGAGSGIGRAICEALALLDWRITLVGRTETTLLETEGELGARLEAERRLPPQTSIIPADVADPLQAKSIVDLTHGKWGRIDALVNNAALFWPRPLRELNDLELRRTFAVNTFGPAHMIARVLPIFERQASGCVINISSMATVDPFPGLAAYAASKCALESLTRSIINERQNPGIRAFSIAPGAVETSMLRSIVSEKELPPNRTLSPMQVAEVVVQCITGLRHQDMGKPIVLPNA